MGLNTVETEIVKTKKIRLAVKPNLNQPQIRNGSANEKGNNRIGEPKVSDDQLTQSNIADMIGISVDILN